MTTDSNLRVKLVITPASLLEQVVAKKLPMMTLVDLGMLGNIINQSDLLFYQWVQTKQKQLLPKHITEFFEVGLNDDDYDDSEVSKLSEIRFKMMTEQPNALMKSLAATIKPNLNQLGDIDDNSYVGHYYAIDKSTIGVVFMASKTPSADEVTALRGLIALLTSKYLGSVDGVADLSNDVHIVNLVKTGLLDAYGKLSIKIGTNHE